MEQVLSFLKRYKHALLLLYGVFYMPCFGYLQSRTGAHLMIHSRIDDFIPFCEYFIIPYLLWFLYVAIPMAVFFFLSPKAFCRLCVYLFTGMTICLLIYTFFPNGQALRPDPARNNFCLRLVRTLWDMDPAINVCPSIHVFNSIGVHIAISRSSYCRTHSWLKYGSLILCILIILSTMFLKQHSIIDVAAAIALSCPMYLLAYRWYPRFQRAKLAIK